MQISIQSIQPSELEAFLDFCEELCDFDGTTKFERESVRAAAQLLLDAPQNGRAVWLLANEVRAGYLVLSFGWSFEFGGRTAVLEHLYVREAFRRRGLGLAAIEWAEAFCESEGVGAVYLGVEANNERAQNLYSKCGFENSNLFFWMKMLPSSSTTAIPTQEGEL